MKKYSHQIILVGVVLAIVGPLLYYRAPYFLATPDIVYVKAKVLQVLHGSLYTDPVTGYATFHPPYYHLLLAVFNYLGLSMNTLLTIIGISNVALIVLFAYMAIKVAFDRDTALYTCLLMPFLFDFMGCRTILLATSFYFSIPIYLAGLWCYLKPDKTIKQSILAAILWGVAFLFSPAYLFLIGLTFVYELLIKKDYRRFGIMVGTFIVTIIPFLIQAIYLYSKDLLGVTTFAFWRGPPNLAWLNEILIEFISPVLNDITRVEAIIHMVILTVAVLVIIRRRQISFFIPLAVLAYLFTFYHFSGQYAIRIQLFLSMFIIASLIDSVRRIKINKFIWLAPLLALALYSYIPHYRLTVAYLEKERDDWQGYQKNGEKFWRVMHNHLDEDEFIFAYKEVYLQYLLPKIRVHGLGAYKDMMYFQLPFYLAVEFERDYRLAMTATDYSVVEAIAKKYRIDTAVFHSKEVEYPLFLLLREHWNAVYMDQSFIIFKKPA